MTDIHQKKQDNNNTGFSPVTAVVAGAIVGAGVAVAGAIALKDKKNREKVKQVFTTVKDQAMGYMEEMQKEIKDQKGVAEKKLAAGKKEVKKEIKKVQSSIKNVQYPKKKSLEK